MFRYALEYYAASTVTDDALGDEEGYEIIAPYSVMFLMARSMELSLKAYLLHKGTTREAIARKISHSLTESLKQAELCGLAQSANIVEDDRKFIAVVDELYNNKEFEYPIMGHKTYPVFGPLQEFGARLLWAAAEVIQRAPQMIKRSRAGNILLAHTNVNERISHIMR